ncbi:MAG: methylmalonyl Co-A mutase-associated GTPase MeaB [Planctomycetota bacterium]
MPMPTLLERFTSRDRGALARLITRAEGRESEFREAMEALYPSTGRAYRIGVTGPPGAGKSTLVDGLAYAFRKFNNTVAVLAVDPSSPFTGGALLGDRIRMRTAEEDPSVFVRSMATRGSLGGLARATVDAADLLDAFGFDRILLETVGVGQAEHDVVAATDTVIVVLYPGGGDSVQAMKAGLMEIADVFVVNKSDHAGADRLVDDIEQMLDLRREREGGRPKIIKVVATQRDGIDELVAAVEHHKKTREENGKLESHRRARRIEQVQRVVEEELRSVIFDSLGYGRWIESELARSRPPYSVANDLVARLRAALHPPNNL